MSAMLTIDITDEVKETLGKAAREDGVSEKALVSRALRDYLFIRRFRSLRERMLAESDKSYTDEQIFELVS